jgi:hypothetical protein
MPAIPGLEVKSRAVLFVHLQLQMELGIGTGCIVKNKTVLRYAKK